MSSEEKKEQPVEQTPVSQKKEQLDTETTFVDMNVEGFGWYSPYKKQKGSQEKISRKEFWKMVGGAFKAYLPLIGILCCVGIIVVMIAVLWLS